MYGGTEGSGEEVVFDGLWITTIRSQWRILREFRISIRDPWETEKLLITEISEQPEGARAEKQRGFLGSV